jgi:hypothetical protein
MISSLDSFLAESLILCSPIKLKKRRLLVTVEQRR